MKNFTLLSLSLLSIMACNNQQNKNTAENTNNKTTAIGGEKDKHGCIAATGQTWSKLKQNCIRVFDTGVRLNPVIVKNGEAVISAFVIFNDDKSKVELFLPGDKKSNIIINKSTDDSYKNDIYKYDAKEAALYINGKKEFVTKN